MSSSFNHGPSLQMPGVCLQALMLAGQRPLLALLLQVLEGTGHHLGATSAPRQAPAEESLGVCAVALATRVLLYTAPFGADTGSGLVSSTVVPLQGPAGGIRSEGRSGAGGRGEGDTEVAVRSWRWQAVKGLLALLEVSTEPPFLSFSGMCLRFVVGDSYVSCASVETGFQCLSYLPGGPRLG